MKTELIKKVRLIVSAQQWADTLEYIGEVTSILIKDGKAHLITDSGITIESISTYPSSHEKINMEFAQDGCRWHHAQRVLSAVEDQPVVLEVGNRILNIIFQYSSLKNLTRP
jgi:hypothetical protein